MKKLFSVLAVVVAMTAVSASAFACGNNVGRNTPTNPTAPTSNNGTAGNANMGNPSGSTTNEGFNHKKN